MTTILLTRLLLLGVFSGLRFALRSSATYVPFWWSVPLEVVSEIAV
jgi:hypothetical protein